MHDSLDVNHNVMVRLVIEDPGAMRGDVLVSGRVTGDEVNRVRGMFERQFGNRVQVVQFDQRGEWGQTVRVAARVDLTGMDTGNLHFYSYDDQTNRTVRIPTPNYHVDASGFLHFSTPFAGSIIISDGPLE